MTAFRSFDAAPSLLLYFAVSTWSASVVHAQDSAPSASRPVAADDAAEVERICELYDEARAAVAEKDIESAVEIAAEADEARSRLPRGDRERIAFSMRMFGSALYSAGRVREALPLYESAHAMNGRLFKGDHQETTQSGYAVATCLLALGRAAEALPLFEAAHAMHRRLFQRDHRDSATSLAGIAICLGELGREAEALPLHEAVQAIYQRLFQGDHPDTAACLNNVASCLLALGRHGESLPRAEAALAMWRRLFKGDHPGAVASLCNVAGCLRDLGRPAEALPRLEAAYAMRRRLSDGDDPGLAAMLDNVAVCLSELGRHGEALPRHEAALAMRKRVYRSDHPEVVLGLNNVAAMLVRLGRPAEALPRFAAAGEMARRLFRGDHKEIAENLHNTASCLGALGRHEEALELTEEERAMYGRLYKGDHPFAAASLDTVAGCLIRLGRAEEALPMAEAAAAMARRRNYPPLTDYLGRLGLLYVAAGGWERATAVFEEAAAAFEARRADALQLAETARGDYEQELGGGRVYAALAEVRARCGDDAGAFTAIERGRRRAALDLLARAHVDALTEARNRAAAAGNAATVAKIDAVGAAIRKAEGEVAQWTHAASSVLARRGLDEAARTAECARIDDGATAARGALQEALAERARHVAAIVPLGQPASVGEAQRLLQGRERLLAYVVDERGSRVFVVRPAGEPVVRRDLRWPGGGAVTAKSLTAAVRDYRAALTAEGRGAAAARGLDLDVATSRPAAASVTTGRRLFAALMPEELWAEVRDAGRIELVPDGALHTLPFEALIVDDERPQSGSSTYAPPQYWLDVGPEVVYGAAAAMSVEARRLRDARREAEPEFAVLSVGNPQFSADDGAASRATPPAAGALVMRVTADAAGAAAGLRRGDVIVAYAGAAIADAKALAAAELAAKLESEEAAGAQPTILLRVWRPDGEAELSAPPGVLGVGVAKEAPPEAWAKLVQGDETTIAVVERGDVVGRRGPLPPLPGARQEATAIAATVEGLHDARRGRLKARLLLGAEATETAVFAAAPKARVLHFATHHLAEETDSGSFSALALTAPALPGAGDDGFLRVHDLLEHWRGRLSTTELVVLSACESQGGEGARDDGIFAMPLAFLFAGAPSVVGSLWRVDDQSTADLMSDFYRKMFDPAANAVSAAGPPPTRLAHFTAARKALRAKRPEPYFWAPFVWMGDPR